MIGAIEIGNYKSIHQLTIKLGRVNVLIGENGCGKSNILEAIALAGAAQANKLDNEFLSSRGIRVTDSKLMRSNFDSKSTDEPILITTHSQTGSDVDEITQTYELQNDNEHYSKWKYKKDRHVDIEGGNISIESLDTMISMLKKTLDSVLKSIPNSADDQLIQELNDKLDEIITQKEQIDDKLDLDLSEENSKLSDFMIYAPENSALRNFYKEGQIEPLGVNGEGLLKLLKVLNEDEPDALIEIDKALSLFGWYDSISIPGKLSQTDDKIQIKDKFIHTTIDQRSANEGFLFILFYIALIVSKDTPKIFAIDNIDVSLNPALCTKIMKVICQLAEKYDKQILLTTHNPAILDGINLADKNQKLYVVSRKRDGHTRIKPITVKNKPKSSTEEPVLLSEAMLRGYLGGLPQGF
ncbi:MAG: putative ATPase [Alteromonadaceae bacterium]|jgi:predicted ATPase